MSHKKYYNKSINKHTSLFGLLLGDFDGDGVRNMDDAFPFDKTRHFKAPSKKVPSLSDAEVKLSSQIIGIQRYGRRIGKGVGIFEKENPEFTGRVKTVPSIINKLRGRFLKDIHDVGGVRTATPDRKSAYEKERQMLEKYKSNPKQRDDFYLHPKNGYRALHNEVYVGKQKIPLEMQIKSLKMQELADGVHSKYKKSRSGKMPQSFIDESNRLYRDEEM